jgi:hypothetical protein
LLSLSFPDSPVAFILFLASFLLSLLHGERQEFFSSPGRREAMPVTEFTQLEIIDKREGRGIDIVQKYRGVDNNGAEGGNLALTLLCC